MTNPGESTPRKNKFTQSTLTHAFGSFTPGESSKRQPFLTLPNTVASTNEASSGKMDSQNSATINLYAEPRNNLPRSVSSTPLLPAGSSFDRSQFLREVAIETKALLPDILQSLPQAQADGKLYRQTDLHALHSHRCPNLPPTRISIVNADTLDTAINMAPGVVDRRPVLILNMANAQHAGGGWLRGALAQEESICYRSSLSFTLKTRFYPMGEYEAIYSPTVVVIRENHDRGHNLFDLTKPDKLPIVSVISMAALCRPALKIGQDGKEIFRYAEDVELTARKMKIILRAAGRNGHRRLVLGALGCGAFENPNNEVASLWKHVLQDPEFAGWWEHIVFAVMDRRGAEDDDSNFRVFWRELEGLSI